MNLDRRFLDQYRAIRLREPEANPERAYYRHRATLDTVLRYSTPGRVLDIGAGWAVESRLLQAAGYSITVMDYGIASSSFGGRFAGLPFQVVDGSVEQPLPFPDESFDVVLLLNVIAHFRDSPRQSLAEIKRVLRPGGILVASTPNIVELRKRLYMLLGASFMPSLDYVWNTPYHSDHHREYTPEEMRTVLEWGGFNIASHEVIDTFWPMSLRVWRGLGRGRDARDKSAFDIQGRWYRPYDIAKQPLRWLCRINPRLRDLVLTVASKPLEAPVS